jgi:hypothetical protein
MVFRGLVRDVRDEVRPLEVVTRPRSVLLLRVRRMECRRKTAPSAWPDLFAKEAIMECDICGQNVENSEVPWWAEHDP